MVCSKCNGTGEVRYYHDVGDHFGAGTSPQSEWTTTPCPDCRPDCCEKCGKEHKQSRCPNCGRRRTK